jgi:hypothetical protein
MRAFVYGMIFGLVAISSVLWTLENLLRLTTTVYLLSMFPKAVYALVPLGSLPIPRGVDPARYLEVAASIPLVVLAARRLVLLQQSGDFTPREFRGALYGFAIAGLLVTVAALAVSAYAKSVVVGIKLMGVAAWIVVPTFVLTEALSLWRAKSLTRPTGPDRVDRNIGT